MTFNPNAHIDTSHVTQRGGGIGGLGGRIAIGGGSLGVIGTIVVILIQLFTGVDLSGVAGGTSGGAYSAGSGAITDDSGSDVSLADCTTGADANRDDDCLVAATADSLDAFWDATLKGNGYTYQSVSGVVLFSGSTDTGCGTGTTDMGPFYCPTDQTIYLDTRFYGELKTQFGASGGQLAKEYVVAHEWGHHIQNLLGIMDDIDQSGTGPYSDSVRLELQADCFAGAWVKGASTTTDENGVAYLQPPTAAQLKDALNAAMVVGDDYIEQHLGSGTVTPEQWTHGSSAARQQWFRSGYDDGVGGCDTFHASDRDLDPGT